MIDMDIDNILVNPDDLHDEICNDSSRFCFGKYEILFASRPVLDDDNYCFGHAMQYLNGAEVKYSETDLQYEIDWKEKYKSINSISFWMPRNEAKLGDIFVTSPYGLIKKNRTGIGATTLELDSPRNSIIVVPTRALAITKAKKSRIEGTEKYRHLYIAGDSHQHGFPSIMDYLSDDSIIHKKFIVVADSLPKLLREIGEEHFPSYFLMVDEIDSYQYDGTYRDSLENVIDYYFRFPSHNRCLVSATVGKFSNEMIENEPVINVSFNEPQPRNIRLLHTDSVSKTAINRILEIREQFPDDKILIAYNYVQGILAIIDKLEEELKDDCAVLCSENSEPFVANYYAEIEEDRLHKKITFMTCAYFVGIDISERFHLISIANSSAFFTLLAEDKFLQIAGRCRDEEGLLSETIIYKAKDNVNDNNLIENVELLEKIKVEARLCADHMNMIPEIAKTFPLLSGLGEINLDNMLKGSAKSYFGTQSIKLVRKDIDGKYQPAYMNIDNILIQFDLLNTLYAMPNNLRQSLAINNNIIDFQNIEEYERDISVESQERKRIVVENEIEKIIELLSPATSIAERTGTANLIKRNSIWQGKRFIERFLELHDYVPFEQLVSQLRQFIYINENEYNRFYDSVMFWALSDDHPFKIAFREKFPLNGRLTSNQITERLNDLLMSNLGLAKLGNTKAVQYLDIFCKKSNRRRDRKSGNVYIIEGYDVNNFNTNPLNIIPANSVLRRIFRFFSNVLTFPL